MRDSYIRIVLLVSALLGFALSSAGFEERPEAVGVIRGTVTIEANRAPLHKATVLLVQLGRVTETGEEGSYEFRDVAPGNYDIVVHSPALADGRQSVRLSPGGVIIQDFQLRIAPIKSQITVTASGSAQTTLEAFQAVISVDAIDLAEKGHTSIGEVLQNQSGVAKRSFGPGNARPVIRGFDGDRVLVMLDGIPTGSLASQSGDHGENLDVLQLERVEVVKGPATLLYGSNAIGGVVNAVSGHHQIQEHPHSGLSGYFTGVGGSANAQGAVNSGFEYGAGRWLLWGGGGGQRTGDYGTPAGTVVNSRTRSEGSYGGFGFYGAKAYFRLGYNYDHRRYGIPFAAFLESGGEAGSDEERANLRLRRHDLRLTGGLLNLDSFLSGVRVVLAYTHYRHGEYEDQALGTDFTNKQFTYRIAVDQKKTGRCSGNFGFSGMHRDYQALGDEVLAPPTTQNSYALFALETIDYEKIAFQAGGRFEHNGYTPDRSFLPARSERVFNGFSGAAGIRVPLWKGSAFVANYTHSFRAPALEELYNHGPHPGNLAYEIGNAELKRERGDGIDLSLRHRAEHLSAEANFFYYSLSDFVFLAPTGQIKDNLFEAKYLQGDSRYLGGEVNLEVQLHKHVWLNTGMDIVNARLRRTDTPLPRIPPLRARTGFDVRYKGFSVKPEAVMVHSQEDVFSTERRTAGYTLFNVNASYTLPRQHVVHVFAVDSFNLGDRLYRNHLSFIKDLAPEIGRGIRFSYTLRFF